MKTDALRQSFLDFFSSFNHRIVPSDSLVPARDPTLLFTGAGMNQFKDYFLGAKRDIKRAASSQKCLRTGDLDVVGRTAYHHSFFEMLGNFSFGDYFKREAIRWAWEFLTGTLLIRPERLQVSVHQEDDEAFGIWEKDIKLPRAMIHRLGDESNFWPANARQDGPNGPCGPCSEIFFDQGAKTGCGKPACGVSCDCGRFAEIWNLVFTQFDRREGGVLAPLAAKNIDTGMGLERLACVMQGKRSNFEIDILEPLVSWVLTTTGVGERGRPDANAIADHARAAAFAVADGVHPSNERRGYVVRKLIRRAVWRAWALGTRKPILHPMVSLVCELMKQPYPELAGVAKEVASAIRHEEERFLETLEGGLERLGRIFKKVREAKAKTLPGDDMFLLYDTFGFPDELTRQLAAQEGLTVDTAGFERLMEEQRRKAKEASFSEAAIFVKGTENPFEGVPKTKFLGHQALEAQARVLKVVDRGVEAVWVALDQTPFYAEGGGQVGDTGSFEALGLEARVLDTQQAGGVTVHHVRVAKGRICEGASLLARVDRDPREATMRNHTATHLLQAALRTLMGTQVRQLGSLVNAEKLRFDFSFPRALTREEILAVEGFVNREILANHSVEKLEKPIEEARREGALSFFGEKYGDHVRVVSVSEVSKELCGGTHVRATGDIGSFLIVSESSVASGTRRIEAITGHAVLSRLRDMDQKLVKLGALLKTSQENLVTRAEQVLKARKQAASESETSGALPSVEDVLALRRPAGACELAVAKLQGAGERELRVLWDRLKAAAERTVVFLASEREDRIHLLCGVTQDLGGQGLHAGRLVQAVAKKLGGSGGGRADLAQGGGTDRQALDKVLAELPGLVRDDAAARKE